MTEKTIVRHSFRTGVHKYQPGAAWTEHDGPTMRGGPYMNYNGKQVGIPNALYEIRVAGCLRKWHVSDAQAKKNMEYYLEDLARVYKRGFDPDGKITEYALDNYSWSSNEKYRAANNVCNRAREMAGLPSLEELEQAAG